MAGTASNILESPYYVGFQPYTSRCAATTRKCSMLCMHAVKIDQLLILRYAGYSSYSSLAIWMSIRFPKATFWERRMQCNNRSSSLISRPGCTVMRRMTWLTATLVWLQNKMKSSNAFSLQRKMCCCIIFME